MVEILLTLILSLTLIIAFCGIVAEDCTCPKWQRKFKKVKENSTV